MTCKNRVEQCGIAEASDQEEGGDPGDYPVSVFDVDKEKNGEQHQQHFGGRKEITIAPEVELMVKGHVNLITRHFPNRYYAHEEQSIWMQVKVEVVCPCIPAKSDDNY